MEYTLRSGKVVTDEQIEAMAEAIEAGSLPGQWSGEVVVGRPRLADEPLDVISFKVPHSAALAIKRAAEQEGESRSAFLRKAALDRAESVLAAARAGGSTQAAPTGLPRLPPIQFCSARTTPPLSARRVPTKSTRLSSHTCS